MKEILQAVKKLLIIVLAVTVSACRLQPNADELLNDMVVVTNYDQSVNFADFPTYTMPLDSVGLITNESTMDWLTDDFATLVTGSVRRNLNNTGRTRVEKDQSPALAINVYVVKNVQMYQNVIYPNYYGGGYGGYYGGYYGYPGYYNYPQVVNYQTQTAILIIEFVDLLNLDPVSHEARVIWAANIGDIINSYDPKKKVDEAIDQAFAQSEYLKP
jgi:hypothetical protein